MFLNHIGIGKHRKSIISTPQNFTDITRIGLKTTYLVLIVHSVHIWRYCLGLGRFLSVVHFTFNTILKYGIEFLCVCGVFVFSECEWDFGFFISLSGMMVVGWRGAAVNCEKCFIRVKSIIL